jgi:2-haloacid dehalogenase
MKKHYPWLWFDADNTLFNYNRAEAAALKQTFHSLSLPYEENYLSIYQGVNNSLWQALERQEITPAVLRFRRFELLLENTRLNSSPDKMSSVYLEQLAVCSELIEGAQDVLKVLHQTSRIAVVTNGLQAVQRSRLAHSAIKDFISELFISEEIGAAKPHTAFFDIVSERTGHPAKSEVLIIGDSLTSDMQGGISYGIDTCWFNPSADPRPKHLPLTYEISQLQELLNIVE